MIRVIEKKVITSLSIHELNTIKLPNSMTVYLPKFYYSDYCESFDFELFEKNFKN